MNVLSRGHERSLHRQSFASWLGSFIYRSERDFAGSMDIMENFTVIWLHQEESLDVKPDNFDNSNISLCFRIILLL